MSRPIFRSLTSAVLLLSILCLALPAAAAPAGRAPKTSILQADGWMDQVFSWLSRLVTGTEPASPSRSQKAGAFFNTGGPVDQASNPAESDRGAMIDPNGSH